VAVALTATPAGADTLIFDDIPDAVGGSLTGEIPDGYGGLNWDGFNYINGPVVASGSGFENGVVSGDYTAFNFLGQVSTVNDTLFTLDSAWMTAAWNTGLTVEIAGLLDGATLVSTNIVVDPFEPTEFTFDSVAGIGIDELMFSSFGGVNAGLGGSGQQFVMDDFSFTVLAMPEPSALSALGLGLAALVAFRRRLLR
jgi:hypothetical protein